MNTKRLVLLVALALSVQNASACTIFVLTDAKRTLFCNNEDWSNPKSRIWFVPAGDRYMGCAYVGFDHGWAQGGMNTKGLAFDWVAGAVGKWKPESAIKVVRGNPSERMLETCATVDEAVAFFRKHRELSFAHARILVADSSGKSALIGVKDGTLQVEDGCRGFGYGQRTLDKMLATAEPTVANGSRILQACFQDGATATQYSNVFNLKSGDIHLFHPSNPSGMKLNLDAEIKKGGHFYDIPLISQQISQPPKPLPNNMKRHFMDEFEPIPDENPGITSHIRSILRNLLDGQAKAEDYTANFWDKMKQGEVQAITDFKPLGKIASFTLVDHSLEGDNQSNRYRVGFKDVMAMEVQLRFVLDSKDKIALIELEGMNYQ